MAYDFWAWPKLRDALVIGDYKYNERKFNVDISEAITISWPDNKTFFSKKDRITEATVSADFEQHVLGYKNWKLSKSWSFIYPELVDLVNIASD